MLEDEHTTPVSRDHIYGLLQACAKRKDLAGARKVHGLMVSNRLHTIAVLGDHLIRLFASCGSLPDANTVFWNITKPTVFTWNAIISAHASLGDGARALALYQSMQQDGIKPVKQTFSVVLKACASVRCLTQGRILHDQISRNETEFDIAVGNALVDMYGKCGSLEEAHRVFDRLPDQTVVSWASIISGYAQFDLGFEVFELFEGMQQQSLIPDKVTFLCVLRTCGSTRALLKGRLIHKQIIGLGFESDLIVGNALVDMYCKCGNLEDACRLFENLENRDVVSWGALISGYVQNNHCFLALHWFSLMRVESMRPDKLIYSSVLKACSDIRKMQKGRLIHEEIALYGLETDIVIGSTLVDMYAQCGSLADAQAVFENLQEKDAVLWGTMIAACVDQCDDCSALEYYGKMREEHLPPDKATLLCILKACANVGAIEEVKLIYQHIIAVGLEIELALGNAVVDAYAKCGNLQEACKVFNGLTNKDVVSWGAMIAGYTRSGDYKLALLCFKEFEQQGLQPDDVIFLGILMACRHMGLIDEGRRYFKSMEVDYGVTPSIQHFNSMVDLLGRAGLLSEGEDILKCSKNMGRDPAGWMSLLIGCNAYGNIEVGRRCFAQLAALEPTHASGYALTSSMYADAHLWENVSKLCELKRYNDVVKKPGTAWIEVNNEMHEFVVGETICSPSNYMSEKTLTMSRQLKENGYMLSSNFIFNTCIN